MQQFILLCLGAQGSHWLMAASSRYGLYLPLNQLLVRVFSTAFGIKLSPALIHEGCFCSMSLIENGLEKGDR